MVGASGGDDWTTGATTVSEADIMGDKGRELKGDETEKEDERN